MAVETVVQPRNEGSHDQQGDPTIVQLREQFPDHLRVAVQSVVSEREPEAHDRADKEHTEYHFLLHLDLNGWPRQEVYGDSDKRDAAEQMCPDVARLGVDAEYGRETSTERRQRGSVALVQIVVVLQPTWQMSEVAHVPRRLPYFPHEFLCLLGRVVSERSEVDLV